MPIQITFGKPPSSPAPEVKASRVFKAIMMGLGLGDTAVPKPDFASLSKAAYERNVFIYSLVNKIARAIATVPWVLMERPAVGVKGARVTRYATQAHAHKALAYDGPNAHLVKKTLAITEIYDHPLLALLERPNTAQAQAQYFEHLVSYLLLSGNSYEEFVTVSDPAKGDQPQEMWPLRPDRVEIIPASSAKSGRMQLRDGSVLEFSRQEMAEAGAVDSLIFRFDYRVGGQVQKFAPDSMIHHKFFHPTDDFYGLSPLLVAQKSWLTDNLANDWNWALLKNEGRPSGALISPTTVDDATFDRVKAEISEATTGGSMGKPLFLEGGMKWEPFGFSPIDLDWQGGKSELRLMMCAAFNTPPEMAGSTEHRTYNSMPEARKAWWMEANLPILAMIRDAYNARLVPRYGDRYYLDFDRDQIDALQEDRNAVWTRVRNADHITIQEKRDATGYDPVDPATIDPDMAELLDLPTVLIPAATGVGVTTNVNGFGGGVGDPPAVDDSTVADPSEEKALRLTPGQKRVQSRLRRRLSKYFQSLGTSLSAHLKRELAQKEDRW